MSTNNQAISDPMVCENGLALSPKAIDFSEKSIRRDFIRKVYGILMCQFLLTMGIIAFLLFYEQNNLFILYNQCILYALIFDVIFTVIILTCFCKCRQTAPWNYIILFTFTVAIAITIGMLAHLADAPEVLIAAGVAAGVCLGIIIFISLTKWDFTRAGGWLLTTILVLFLYGVITLSFPPTRTTLMLCLGIAVLLYSLYLVYDIKLMIKGEHWFSLSPEEYVFAALHLYLVILYMLLFLILYYVHTKTLWRTDPYSTV